MRNYEHIETFKIGEMTMKLGFYSHGCGYSHDVLEGYSGCGGTYGGVNTLQEAIEEAKKEHIYCYNFFNHGYKQAKESVKNLK